jgi:HlyD family secretion protein
MAEIELKKESVLPVAAKPPKRGRGSAIGVSLGLLAIIGFCFWFLTRPTPLLIQGEADSTRTDMAARVDGRIVKIFVQRGENVEAGAALLQIDNPELAARYREAIANRVVAEANLANVRVGTRAETVAVRKADVDKTASDVTLAEKTFERMRALVAIAAASQQQLEQATAQLDVARRSNEQAALSYQEAVAGHTVEEVRIAETKVTQAEASAETLKAQLDQLTVYAPSAGQVYQINIELGEVVSPGVPLLSLVDLDDVWIRFDLREDLAKNLKDNDTFGVRIPALADRPVEVQVRLVAAKGEYAGWRATRATGDFDLRTFAIRAYPVQRMPGLRPGMSAYADWGKG